MLEVEETEDAVTQHVGYDIEIHTTAHVKRSEDISSIEDVLRKVKYVRDV